MVVLGGGVADVGPTLLDTVHEARAERAGHSELLGALALGDRLRLGPGALPVGAIGAALLARQRLCDDVLPRRRRRGRVSGVSRLGGTASGSIAVVGGSVVHRDRIERADVLIRDGAVVEAGMAVEVPSGIPVVDVGGLLVAPGFIDLQINGALGIDLADEPERLSKVGTSCPASV